MHTNPEPEYTYHTHSYFNFDLLNKEWLSTIKDTALDHRGRAFHVDQPVINTTNNNHGYIRSFEYQKSVDPARGTLYARIEYDGLPTPLIGVWLVNLEPVELIETPENNINLKPECYGSF